MYPDGPETRALKGTEAWALIPRYSRPGPSAKLRDGKRGGGPLGTHPGLLKCFMKPDSRERSPRSSHQSVRDPDSCLGLGYQPQHLLRNNTTSV